MRRVLATLILVLPLAAQTTSQTFEFVSTEMSFGGRVVKGAPYSAEAVTESNQVLSDGNRISRRSTAKLYRDSEGRTRREQTLDSIGPWARRAGRAPLTPAARVSLRAGRAARTRACRRTSRSTRA